MALGLSKSHQAMLTVLVACGVNVITLELLVK